MPTSLCSYYGGRREKEAEGADQNPQAAGESSCLLIKRLHCLLLVYGAHTSAAAGPGWLFVGFIDAAIQRAALLFPFVKLVICFLPSPNSNALVQSGFISGCFYCLPNVGAILRHCFFSFFFHRKRLSVFSRYGWRRNSGRSKF